MSPSESSGARSRGAVFLALLVSTLVAVACGGIDANLPRASEDATRQIRLRSDKEGTVFYVDDRKVGRGKNVSVLVSDRVHQITAEPPGYRMKESSIEPPFDESFTHDFVFLVEDRVSAPPEPRPGQPEPPRVAVASTVPAAPAAPAGRPVDEFAPLAAIPQAGALALIIGIESYRSLPAPTGARRDAARLEAVMRRTFGIPAVRMKVLTDGQATRSDILAGLDWVQTNAKPGTRVYFYFSGHGSPEPSTGTPYLLPYEASPDNLVQSGLKLEDVVAKLAQSKAREVVALVDSCFSGLGDRSVLAPGTRALVRVKETPPPSQVVLLSASRADEASGPATGESMGAFSKFLSEGLGMGTADANGDGQITAQELHDWVAPRVARAAQEQHRKQTPQLVVGGQVGGADKVILGYGYR